MMKNKTELLLLLKNIENDINEIIKQVGFDNNYVDEEKLEKLLRVTAEIKEISNKTD